MVAPLLFLAGTPIIEPSEANGGAPNSAPSFDPVEKLGVLIHEIAVLLSPMKPMDGIHVEIYPHPTIVTTVNSCSKSCRMFDRALP